MLDGVPSEKDAYIKALLAKTEELLTKCAENGHAPSYNSLGMLYSYPPLVLHPYMTVDWTRAFLCYFKVTCGVGGQLLPESYTYTCRQCASLIAEGIVSISERADPMLLEKLGAIDISEAELGSPLNRTEAMLIRRFLSHLRNQDDIYINYLNGLVLEREGQYKAAADYYYRCCKNSTKELMPEVRLYTLIDKNVDVKERFGEIDLESLAQRIHSTANDISARAVAADQYDGIYTLDLAYSVLKENEIGYDKLLPGMHIEQRLIRT